jgi:peptide/nickel transport system substrate-binding protein
MAVIPYYHTQLNGAARTDEVELGGIGEMGVDNTNPFVWFDSDSRNGNRISGNMSVPTTQTTNFPTLDNSPSVLIWSNLVHSTLTMYNSELEFQNALASSVEETNGGKTITVELKDATFHNGDPVTAEDVKFTFEHLTANSGSFPQSGNPPYADEPVTVVDEQTARFNLMEPFPPLLTREWPRWGVLHKQTWVEGGAPDDPDGFEMDTDNIVGSGPFQVENFEIGGSMVLTPHDDNPVASPTMDVVLTPFRDTQSAFRAFQQNEIQMFQRITPPLVEDIQESMSNTAQVTVFRGFMPYFLVPQWPMAPTKFRPFRNAIGKVIDRQRLNAVTWQGNNEPIYGGQLFAGDHPFRPPDDQITKFTEEPTGDPEAARQVLEEAGWGFDDDGNLHYPPDADLNPLWPQGEVPNADNGFPCLDGSSNWVQPSER